MRVMYCRKGFRYRKGVLLSLISLGDKSVVLGFERVVIQRTVFSIRKLFKLMAR